MKEVYRNSSININLTPFPEYEYLNSLYENGFIKEKYDFLKMRFESQPPFVYFFNPDIQLEKIFGINTNENRFYEIDFYSKGTNVRLLEI